MEESDFSAPAYDRVYDAPRPEIFFKSLGQKVVGPDDAVGIRKDAQWNVPEPELALIMNANAQGDHIASVALTGRVPIKVIGPIAKGDMLVSAGDGKARAEADPKIGSVIGKSLEDHEDGNGIIEAVVGKH